MPKLKPFLILIGFFLVIKLIYKLNWQAFYLVMQKFQILDFVLVLAFIFISLLFKCLRFNLLLEKQIGFHLGASIFYQSLFYGQITPARLGEFSRIGLLNQAGFSLKQATYILIQDRFFDALILLLGFLSIFSLKSLFLWLILVFFHQRISQSFFKSFNFFKYLKSLCLSFLAYLLFALSFAVLFYKANLKAQILNIIQVVFASTLAAWLPISYQGLGTKEIVYLYYFNEIPFDSIMAISLSHFILNVLGSLVICGLMAYFYSIKKAP